MPPVYIVLFWHDRTQSVAQHAVLFDRPSAVRFATSCLRSHEVSEPGYEDFLLEQLRRWDGIGSHTITVAQGKIVLLATQPLTNVFDDPVPMSELVG